jgi:hypothetical protein
MPVFLMGIDSLLNCGNNLACRNQFMKWVVMTFKSSMALLIALSALFSAAAKIPSANAATVFTSQDAFNRAFV